jgi:hypothetical protein
MPPPKGSPAITYQIDDVDDGEDAPAESWPETAAANGLAGPVVVREASQSSGLRFFGSGFGKPPLDKRPPMTAPVTEVAATTGGARKKQARKGLQPPPAAEVGVPFCPMLGKQVQPPPAAKAAAKKAAAKKAAKAARAAKAAAKAVAKAAAKAAAAKPKPTDQEPTDPPGSGTRFQQLSRASPRARVAILSPKGNRTELQVNYGGTSAEAGAAAKPKKRPAATPVPNRAKRARPEVDYGGAGSSAGSSSRASQVSRGSSIGSAQSIPYTPSSEESAEASPIARHAAGKLVLLQAPFDAVEEPDPSPVQRPIVHTLVRTTTTHVPPPRTYHHARTTTTTTTRARIEQ